MFDSLLRLFFDHWGQWLGGLAFLVCIPAYLWQRYLWGKRRFLTRVNYSLNFMEDNTLKFRTLRETNLELAMLNNRHVIRLVMKATRSEKPGAFLLFKDKDEAWTILTMLLNELSAEYGEGFVARSMGLATQSEWFYIGITCEEHPDLKTTKFRVMMVAKKMLENIDAVDHVKFEQPQHHIRLITLRQMWQIVRDEQLKHNIMQIELSMKT